MRYNRDHRTVRFLPLTGSPQEVGPVSYGEYRAIRERTAKARRTALSMTIYTAFCAVTTALVGALILSNNATTAQAILITLAAISTAGAGVMAATAYLVAGSQERAEAERVLSRQGLTNTRVIHVLFTQSTVPACGACQNPARQEGAAWVCDDCGLTYQGLTALASYTDPDAEPCRAPCENRLHVDRPIGYHCGTCILPAGHHSPFHHTDCD